MDFTATIDLNENYKWTGKSGGVQKHAEHDLEHKNTSNEYLQSDLSKRARIYNRVGNCAKIENVIEKYYGGDTLQNHNATQLKNRHKEKIYRSAIEFARHTGSSDNPESYYQTMVATFSDKKTTEQLFKTVKKLKSSKGLTDEQIHDKIFSGISKGLEKYSRGFNHRNSAMTLTDYMTNVDEYGAYHVHAQIIPHGHTKKGKISNSIDTALVEQGFQGKNNKERLSAWRLKEDKRLVSQVRKGLAEEFEDIPRFKLWRKGEHGGLSHDDYIANQESLNAREARLSKKSGAVRQASVAASLNARSYATSKMFADMSIVSAEKSLSAESQAASADRYAAQVLSVQASIASFSADLNLSQADSSSSQSKRKFSEAESLNSITNAQSEQNDTDRNSITKQRQRLIRLISRCLKVLFPEWATNLTDKFNPWYAVADDSNPTYYTNPNNRNEHLKGVDAVTYGVSRASESQLKKLSKIKTKSQNNIKNDELDK